MKIKKCEFDESKKLFTEMESARGIDLSGEILPIEKKILELDKLYQRERTLRHNSEMQAYQNQKDLLFGQIGVLKQGKVQAIENCINNFDKFHRTFKSRFVEKLIFLFCKIEAETVFNVLDSSELMFSRRHKVSTNAVQILGCLSDISMEIAFFNENRLPLSDLNERLEIFEKSLTSDFPEKIFSIVGDAELIQCRDLMPDPSEYDNPEYKPLIYSPEVIGHKITLIQEFLK